MTQAIMADPVGPRPVDAGYQALRQELIETQKARSDLLKYKLVVCAALGAVAIGIGSATEGRRLPLVLALLPLACLYVDILCAHNNLRILVIGRFLAETDSVYRDYERLCERLRRPAFGLEDGALTWSSVFVGVVLAGIGAWAGVLAPSRDPVFGGVLALSGVGGVVATLVLSHQHRRRAGAITNGVQ